VDSAKPVTVAVGERLHDRWQVPGPQEQRRVDEALRAIDGAVERQEANCSYRLDFQAGAERVIARQFNTGTLTLQQVSPGAADSPLFGDLRGRVRAALGQPLDAELPQRGSVAPHESPSAAGAVEVDPARVFTGSWIGTDEAGKGDYFGPLVSAAMYVDAEIVRKLQELGVRDSKKLSDGRVRELAAAIRERCGTRVLRVVPLMPEAYNRLHEQFVEEGKSLNTLLAWAHARAIEDLLKRDVDTDNVLVDQFTDVKYITAALLQEGRTRHINLVAAPRAESNIAVAAASILARDRFLSWIESESHRVGMVLPKGASDAVVAAARELVERLGEPALRRFVKLHFRTTQKVIGAPATPA